MSKVFLGGRCQFILIGIEILIGIFLLVVFVWQYEKNQYLAEELSIKLAYVQHLETLAESKVDELPSPLQTDWYGQNGYLNVSLLSLLTNPRVRWPKNRCRRLLPDRWLRG